MPRRLRRCAVALCSGVLALVLAEVTLYLATPAVVRETLYSREIGTGSPLHPQRRIMQHDSDLGYRPSPGGKLYDERGVLPNDYSSAKPAGVRRLLFIGDSVTKRAEIITGLREELGEEGIEYWNAGVEGYNAHQVVRYYVDHLKNLHEDHVIFTVHMNDFLVTPLSFIDSEGKLVLYESTEEASPWKQWWLRNSALGRWVLALRSDKPDRNTSAKSADALRQALVDLQEAAAARDVELTVLIFPMLHPRKTWKQVRIDDHQLLLDYVTQLNLRFFDLSELAESARAEELMIMAGPRDVNHPSAEFGTYVGHALTAQGFRP